jgi:hypothetical protein
MTFDFQVRNAAELSLITCDYNQDNERAWAARRAGLATKKV